MCLRVLDGTKRTRRENFIRVLCKSGNWDVSAQLVLQLSCQFYKFAAAQVEVNGVEKQIVSNPAYILLVLQSSGFFCSEN